MLRDLSFEPSTLFSKPRFRVFVGKNVLSKPLYFLSPDKDIKLSSGSFLTDHFCVVATNVRYECSAGYRLIGRTERGRLISLKALAYNYWKLSE